MYVSLVIPAYNESAVIGDTVKSVMDRLPQKFDRFELIVVDDGSTDRTGDVVSALRYRGVSLIRGNRNRGKGHAIREGMLSAHGDYVFFTDADLAYGLDPVVRGVRLLAETGADVVVGSRRIIPGGYGQYPAHRLVASKCFSLVLRAASGMEYDAQCGLKGFTQRAARDLFRACVTNGYAFDFEVLQLALTRGYRIVELPVQIINHGQSRVKVARDGFKMLGEVAEIRRSFKRTEDTAQ